MEGVARGDVRGKSMMYAFGEAEDMGTTASGEDIWRGGELSQAPSSVTEIPTPASGGETLAVVSESADDKSDGTGVQKVTLAYLDTSGVEQTEEVTLNGATPVPTDATDIMFVNDMYSTQVGSGGVAAGNIAVHKSGTVASVYNMIAEGGNKSMVSQRMVPAGKKLTVVGWHAAETKGKRVNMRIRATAYDGVLLSGIYLFKDVAYINKTTTGWLPVYFVAPALSIVKVTGWPDVADAEVSCSWRGILSDV